MTAFLFDLDGTLADTLPLILRAAQLALAEFGVEATDEKIISLIGVPLVETGEILLGAGRGEEYRECYHKHFLTLDSSNLAAFPGIKELLAELERRGASLACVTSKRREPTENTLVKIGLREFFPVVIAAESSEHHKPHGEPALLALAALGVKEKKALFIGDSVFDVGCAQNAGLPCCAVTWGAEKEQRLREAGAACIAHDVAELAEILLSQLI